MKRYTSGFITADDSLSNILIPNAGAPASGKLYSISEHLQYKNAGYWPVVPDPPFPIYTSLSYSNSFDGTGDYLSVPSNAALQFGTGDFTIEGWIYQTAFSGDTPITASYQTWATSVNFYFATRAGSPNVLIFRAGDSVPISLVGNTSIPINTWTHVAVARSSGVTKIFVNGTEQTATHTGSVNISATALATGIGASQGGLEPFTGYISNLRFVKGQAVYTGNFSVPTSPLAITQSSSSNVASIISTIPSIGNSVYFNGSSRLTATGSTAYTFGTNDFTVEFWAYFTSIPATYNHVVGTAGSAGGFGFGLGGSAKLYITSSTTGYESSGATIATNIWYHIAFTRQSGTVRMFVNGVLDNTINGLTTDITETGGTIGAYFNGAYTTTGYISNHRVVKGTALYTSSFSGSLPSAPLTAISGTSILTCQSSTIIDNGPSALSLTSAGTPTVALTDSPFGFSNVRLLTAQSPTVIDNSLNNLTITVNGDTKALALSPFAATLQSAYLAVAGGGGGGGQGGGGGAGGLLYRTNLILVPNVTYTITVGAGAVSTSPGSSFGSPSTITNAGFAANITAVGGGAGQSRDVGVPGGIGGSGGGGGAGASGGSATGAAGTAGQGNAGAPGGYPGSGGGGGGGAGAAGNPGAIYGGNGGAGVYLTISGSNVAYAGGGGGGGVSGQNNGGGAGGIGGGGGASHGTTGGGGSASGTLSNTAVSGTYGPGAVNTGGGGGGGAVAAAGLGGSGIVILASNTYQAANVTGNPNVTYSNGNTLAIYRFWQSGTIRW